MTDPFDLKGERQSAYAYSRSEWRKLNNIPSPKVRTT